MAGLTKTTNISVTSRSIDFVTRFTKNFQALLDILGVTRLDEIQPDTNLRVIESSIALESGAVSEGETIPLSVASVTERSIGTADFTKYRKGVTIEAIQKYGFGNAIERTDDAMLNKIQRNITDAFYTFLKSGTLTSTESTWQMAMAMAKGRVLNFFSDNDMDVTEVVAFVNILDLYEYLGGATISLQTSFGLSYIENFMGYRVVFVLDADKIPRNKVIAVPVDNIVCRYINPNNSDLAQAGFEFTVDGVTPFVGFHPEVDYSNVTAVNTAIYGIYLFAEYLMGISVVTVGGSMGSLTVTSTAGTETVGDTVVSITESVIAGGKFYWKAQASTAPADATYGKEFDATGWTAVKSGDTVASTNGHKYRLVEVNAAGQAVASATGTVAAKAS